MPNDYAALLKNALEALRQARKHLNREIAAYPTPISGCDAQFNHLLADRQRISAALRSLGQDVFIATPRNPSSEGEIESR